MTIFQSQDVNNSNLAEGSKDLIAENEIDGEYELPFSRKMVKSLRKWNMCIRPISTKGSAAAKRKSKEVTNQIRAWEKEVSVEDGNIDQGLDVYL